MITRACAGAEERRAAVGDLAAHALHRACPGAYRTGDEGRLGFCECDCHARHAQRGFAPPTEADFEGVALPVLDLPKAASAPGPVSKRNVRPPRGRCEHCGIPCRSRFAVGHDAKLKGELIRRGKANDPFALAELHLRGWRRIEQPRTAIERSALELAEREGWDLVERAVERRLASFSSQQGTAVVE